jgi:hypothetical protein
MRSREDAVAFGADERLALVPWKAHEPRVRAGWQRGLGAIDPGPERAVDAGDVYGRVVLDE